MALMQRLGSVTSLTRLLNRASSASSTHFLLFPLSLAYHECLFYELDTWSMVGKISNLMLQLQEHENKRRHLETITAIQTERNCDVKIKRHVTSVLNNASEFDIVRLQACQNYGVLQRHKQGSLDEL